MKTIFAAGALLNHRTMATRPAMLIGALIAGLAVTPGYADDDPELDSKEQQAAPTAFAANEPKPVLNWGEGDGKSYFVPIYEIVGFEFALNRFNHYFIDDEVYTSPSANLRKNLHGRWVVDNDKFSTNQFLHPYQGAVYQGLARSAGLGFWESFAYPMVGSLLWEEAGENTSPSINDQVASGIGGNFLGEPLFRMASLLLESSGSSRPGLWSEVGAAAISPATGFNRAAHGSRFDGVFRSHDPAVFTRLDLGASLSTHFSSNVSVNADPSAPIARQTLDRGQVTADFTMSYGLPGKPGYSYTRPFDYFHFEAIASSSDGFESVFSRGLLYGTPYSAGDNYRGIWGLYGSYDYAAPQIFRVSTTAASLGTTAQWWLSRRVALQGTALLGIGYGGGGVIHGSGVAEAGPAGDGQRDYHYGITPQQLVALRLIFGDRVSLDTTVRDYYISHVAATESTGTENIVRAEVTLTVRVYNLHGIMLRYAESQRDGNYAGLPHSHQSVGVVSVGYALLGQTRFGAVDWRPHSAGGP